MIIMITVFLDFFIVKYSKGHKRTQRFGSWICFLPQLSGTIYSVGSLRAKPQSLDNLCRYNFIFFLEHRASVKRIVSLQFLFFLFGGVGPNPLRSFAGPLGSYKSQCCGHTFAYCTSFPG
jgi:hypothetical protein